MINNQTINDSSSSSNSISNIAANVANSNNINPINNATITSSKLASSSTLNNNNNSIYFQLSEPFKLNNNNNNSNNKSSSNYEQKKKDHDDLVILFEFNEPIKLNKTLKLFQKDDQQLITNNNNNYSNTNNNNNNRSHVVLVEQAPFSVYKSVKSQEHNDQDKSNNNVVVINSIRNHPYNNSIRPINLINQQQQQQTNNLVQETSNNLNNSNTTNNLIKLNETNSNNLIKIPSSCPINNQINSILSSLSSSTPATSNATAASFTISDSFLSSSSSSSKVPSSNLTQTQPTSNNNSNNKTNSFKENFNTIINTNTINQNTKVQQQQQQQQQAVKSLNRNSSSNAILAHLKSLGPNFKSIFVRPKHSKHIDSSLILNKPKVKNLFEKSNLDLLNEQQSLSSSYITKHSTSSNQFSYLYNKSNNNNGTSLTKSTIQNNENKLLHNPSLIIKLLPSIEPKELRLNQSVDDLLKKFATENDILSKTIKNISNLSSSSPARSASSANSTPSSSQSLSPLHSKYPGATNLFTNSLAYDHHHLSISKQNQTSKLSNKQILDSRQQLQVVEKWTCMVCLSKHTDKTEICTICGSSKPDATETQQTKPSQSISFSKHYATTTKIDKLTSKNSFTSNLINELGLSSNRSDNNSLKISTDSDDQNKHPQQPQQQQQQQKSLSSQSDSEDANKGKLLQMSPKSNPYLKKWTCIHCNYSNDSLKIVCLNCRWIKTSTTKAKQAQLLNESIKSPSKGTLDKLTANHNRLISQEHEQDNKIESPSKRSKQTEETNQNVCLSCKSPIQDKQPTTPTTIAPTTSSLASLFNQSKSSKWECSTCLAKNDNDKLKCVCCQSDRPNSCSSNTTLASQFKSSKWNCPTCLASNDMEKVKCACCDTAKPDSSTTSSTNSLASQFSQTKSSKWNCPTCLASNDMDKVKCACCQTAKPGSSSTETAPASTSSLSSLFSQANNSKWKCSTCLASNDNDKLKCVCCLTDKSDDANKAKTTQNKPFTLSSEPTLILPVEQSTSSIKFGLTSSDSANNVKINFGTTNTNIITNLPKSQESGGFKISFDSSITATATTSPSSLFKQPDDKQQQTSGLTFGFKPLLTTTPVDHQQSNDKKESLTSNNNLFNTTSNLSSNSSPFKFGSGSLSSSSTSSTPKQQQAASNSFALNFGSTASNTITSTITPFKFGTNNESSLTQTPTAPLTNTSLAASTQLKSLFASNDMNTNKPQATTTTPSFFGQSSTKPQETPTAFDSNKTTTPSIEGLGGGNNNNSLNKTPLFGGFGSMTQTPAPSLNQPTSTVINTSNNTFFKLPNPSQTTATEKPTVGGFFNSTSKPSDAPSLFCSTNSNPFSSQNTTTKPVFPSQQQQQQQQQQQSTSNSLLNFSQPQSSLFGTSTPAPNINPFGQSKPNDISSSTTAFQSSTPSFPQFSFNSPINTTSSSTSTLSSTNTPQTTSFFNGNNLNNKTPQSSLITPPQSSLNMGGGTQQFSLFQSGIGTGANTTTTATTTPIVGSSFNSLKTSASQSSDDLIGQKSSKLQMGKSGNIINLNNSATSSTPSNQMQNGFNFNPTPNLNFNFSTSSQTPLQTNGIIQFSGNNDTNATGGSNDRRFRRAVRRNANR